MSHAVDDTDAAGQDATPAYILDACQAAGEWWARSDRDPRIKFQPAIIMRLLTELREGAHYEPACVVAGVSYRQFREWMNRADDEGPDTPFGVVAAAVKVAEAEAENESVRYVRAASRLPQFWAAGMTFLERRHPNRWRRPDAAPVNVNVGVALGFQVSDEQRRAIVPTVQIVQIAHVNGVLPRAGDTTSPDATFASDASLSPVSLNSCAVENPSK